MANIVLDFLHNYQTGERRETEPANAYQYDEGHVLEAVLPEVITSAEIHYWIRGMEEADAYTPTSITPNEDNSCTVLGNIPNSYFETNGELRIYIVVTDGTASITTYEGKLHICQRSMPDDYVDDDPENEATRVLVEARAAAATATEAAQTAQDVADSIPADYTQLSDDVSSLKEDFDYIGIKERQIDFSQYKEIKGIIASSNVWSGYDGDTNSSILVTGIIPTSQITITAGNIEAHVSFLKTVPTQPFDATHPSINFCAGETGRHAIAPHQTEILTVPNDCECICITKLLNAENHTPSAVIGTMVADGELRRIDKSISSSKKENAENSTQTVVDATESIQLYGAVAIYSPDSTPLIFTTNGSINVSSATGWNCAIIPCAPGDVFVVSGAGGTGNYRLYSFVGEIKPDATTVACISACSAEESSVGGIDKQIVAPVGAMYAVFNFKWTNVENTIRHIHADTTSYIYNELGTLQSRTNHVRFMVFGNSYGMDSITYVPFILKNLGITSEIYLYRRDACTLRDIYNRWESADATDTETDGIHAGTYSRTVYRIDTRTDTSWRVINRISMKDCVELGGWDFITLQQWSAYSIDATTYTPWLPLVIDKIRQSVDGATMLAWTQVCTRASHDDQQASLQVFKELPYGEYPFDFYIPYGTAIFNARANATLAELGDYSEHNFWKDGIHLQDGLPRYIAALTVCEAICRKFFPKKSVMYDKTRPTSDAISSWGNNMPMTPSVGITEENCLLAQYSVINACNHMFEIIPTKSLPSVPST